MFQKLLVNELKVVPAQIHRPNFEGICNLLQLHACFSECHRRTASNGNSICVKTVSHSLPGAAEPLPIEDWELVTLIAAVSFVSATYKIGR